MSPAVQVMGVVNVTDDSFSDGGLFLDRDRAIAHGVELAAQGAAIVDVGGESTRPGATRIDAEVVVLAPGLRMPRIAMQRCWASITTITPRGSSLRINASAICAVSRS